MNQGTIRFVVLFVFGCTLATMGEARQVHATSLVLLGATTAEGPLPNSVPPGSGGFGCDSHDLGPPLFPPLLFNGTHLQFRLPPGVDASAITTVNGTTCLNLPPPPTQPEDTDSSRNGTATSSGRASIAKPSSASSNRFGRRSGGGRGSNDGSHPVAPDGDAAFGGPSHPNAPTAGGHRSRLPHPPRSKNASDHPDRYAPPRPPRNTTASRDGSGGSHGGFRGMTSGHMNMTANAEGPLNITLPIVAYNGTGPIPAAALPPPPCPGGPDKGGPGGPGGKGTPLGGPGAFGDMQGPQGADGGNNRFGDSPGWFNGPQNGPQNGPGRHSGGGGGTGGGGPQQAGGQQNGGRNSG